ncbi:MAG: response regulator [Pirellulaceae bacterium]|jgi:CheY-like chemotaxis protein|nr:response regulator [Pirellulaceae bacterium]
MIQDVCPQLDAAAAAHNRRQAILIVDDDREQVAALALRLERLGFATLRAHEGRTGLQLARERHPDVVLLDLRLPDLDGLAICGELADGPETSHIPIIIVSGCDEPDVVRSARAAGCEYFIGKPYDPNVLLMLIQHAIRHDLDEWLT